MTTEIKKQFISNVDLTNVFIDIRNPEMLTIEQSDNGNTIWMCVNGVTIVRVQGVNADNSNFKLKKNTFKI